MPIVPSLSTNKFNSVDLKSQIYFNWHGREFLMGILEWLAFAKEVLKGWTIAHIVEYNISSNNYLWMLCLLFVHEFYALEALDEFSSIFPWFTNLKKQPYQRNDLPAKHQEAFKDCLIPWKESAGFSRQKIAIQLVFLKIFRVKNSQVESIFPIMTMD